MVFLYVPNIIGYIRFIFLFASLYTFSQHPLLTILFYGLSQFMDMLDGMAARAFNQCSMFGSVLDMVCDRASNGVMLAILGSFYPQYAWFFYSDIILDLVSHWFQMYSSLSSGEHHKNSKTNWKLLEIYYHNKIVLGGLVFGNELFLLTAYLNAFQDKFSMPSIMWQINTVGIQVGFVLFMIKKLMSVIQLISACQKIVQIDQKKIRQIKKE